MVAVDNSGIINTIGRLVLYVADAERSLILLGLRFVAVLLDLAR